MNPVASLRSLLPVLCFVIFTLSPARAETQNPIVDIEGTWESYSENTNDWIYTLTLKRSGLTNNALYTDFGYTGKLEVAYWTTVVSPLFDVKYDYPISCRIKYDAGGYLRIPHFSEGLSGGAAGTCQLFLIGTNRVRFYADQPLTNLTVAINTPSSGWPAQELANGNLTISMSFADHRGDWDTNIIDVCDAYIHWTPIFKAATMRRVPGLDPVLDVKGTIYGELRSENPTLTEVEHAVHRADLALYAQREWIWKQKAGQSDAEYALYMQRVLATRTRLAIAHIEVNDQGRFEFSDLPLFHVVFRDGSWRHESIPYTIEVRNAETDEWTLISPGTGLDTNHTEVLYFATKDFNNVVPDEDEHVFELKSFDGIGAKEALANQLTEISRTHYLAPEARVLDYLSELKAQTTRTPQSLEGLKRALWAERVVRDGSLSAKGLTDAMMEALANLVGDVLGDSSAFKRDGLLQRQEFLKKIQSDPARARGWGALGPNLRRVLNDDLGSLSEGATIMKNFLKVLLGEMKALLTFAGMDDARTLKVAGYLEKSFNTVLNAAISQNALGASREVIKAVIKSGGSLVFDGDELSFTESSAPLLEYSADQMQSWSRADDAAYSEARAGVVTALTQIGDESTRAWSILDRTLGSADAISTTETAAGVLGAKPIAIALKIAKYLNNTASFAGAASMVFYTIPRIMEDGVYRAYGASAPPSPPRVRTASTILNGINARLYATASTKVSSLRGLLNQIPGKFSTNDFSPMIDLLAGTNGPSLAQLRGETHAAIDVLRAQALGSIAVNEANARAPAASLAAEMELNAGISSLLDQLYVMVTNAYTLQYSGPSDPRFAAHRNYFLALHKKVMAAVDALDAAVSAVYSATPSRPLPVVYVAPLTVVSDSSGTSEIRSSPEEFTVQAHIRNISNWPLTGISASLQMDAETNRVLLLTATTNAIGNLSFDNGAGDSGPDETNLTWKVRVTGPLSNSAPIFLTVQLQQNGSAPADFYSAGATALLSTPELSVDADGDGLPDSWEAAFGLDPAAYDADADPDGDGLSNGREFELGTSPMNADSDGDGLSDLEEVTAGQDGFITNPLLADSDGDGLADAADPAPNTPGDEGPSFRYASPGITVEPQVVTLGGTQVFATVMVQGATNRFWTAAAADPALIGTVPAGSDARPPGELIISSAGYLSFSTPGVIVTTVRINDLLAGPDSHQEVTVLINGTIGSALPISAKLETQGLTLSWPAAAGRKYVVQFSEDLTGWTTSPTGTFQDTASGQQIVTWIDSGFPGTPAQLKTAHARFYRVLPIQSE